MGTNFSKIKKGLNLESVIGPPANLEPGDIYFDGYLGQLQFSADGISTRSAGSLEILGNNSIIVPSAIAINFGTNLHVALGYAVLAASTITNTGLSTINGNLGLYPGTSVTGFPPGTISGSEDLANSSAHAAQSAALVSYNQYAGLPAGTPISVLDSQTLIPGTYTSSTSVSLATSSSATLTLNGAGVYIFQIGSTLTTGAGGTPTILLTNGATAANIYWIVGSSATISSGFPGTFYGNVIAQASIGVTSGGIVNGTLIALNGAITLSATTTINSTALANTASISTGDQGFNVTGGNLTASNDVLVTGTVKTNALDVLTVGNLVIGASVGANTITLGGSSSILSIPGSITSSGDILMATNTGIQNAAASSTLNIGSAGNTASLNVGTGSNVNVVNIGTGSGVTTINLGGPGDVVNISGTLNNITTTNTNITDSLIILNKGGSSSSGNASGIAVEEGGILDGYVFVGNNRLSWDIIAPASTGTMRLTPDAYISEIKTVALTANRTYTLQDSSDIIIGRITTDLGANRLQNKDLDDATVSIVSSTDTTRKLIFSVGNQSSGRTVTISTGGNTNNILLNLPGITDTLIGRTTSDTLTNKILSGNTVTNLVNGSGTFNFNSTGTLTAPGVTGTVTAFAIQTISANTVLVSGNTYFVNTSASRILTLPSPALNAYVFIKDSTGNAATNAITLNTPSGLIDGAASQTLGKNWGTWALASDGTNWFFMVNSSVALGGSL